MRRGIFLQRFSWRYILVLGNTCAIYIRFLDSDIVINLKFCIPQSYSFFYLSPNYLWNLRCLFFNGFVEFSRLTDILFITHLIIVVVCFLPHICSLFLPKKITWTILSFKLSCDLHRKYLFHYFHDKFRWQENFPLHYLRNCLAMIHWVQVFFLNVESPSDGMVFPWEIIMIENVVRRNYHEALFTCSHCPQLEKIRTERQIRMK